MCVCVCVCVATAMPVIVMQSVCTDSGVRLLIFCFISYVCWDFLFLSESLFLDYFKTLSASVFPVSYRSSQEFMKSWERYYQKNKGAKIEFSLMYTLLCRVLQTSQEESCLAMSCWKSVTPHPCWSKAHHRKLPIRTVRNLQDCRLCRSLLKCSQTVEQLVRKEWVKMFQKVVLGHSA